MKHLLLTTIAAVVLAGCVGSASGPTDPPGQATVAGPRLAKRVGGLEPRQVVALFGANGLEGVPDRVLVNYRRVFGFGDADNDGRHSKKEYVNDGLYLTLRARQGIFRAADSDNDGFVTEAEYVENRVITDEAKEIFDDMDADGDGRLTAGELETRWEVEGPGASPSGIQGAGQGRQRRTRDSRVPPGLGALGQQPS